MTMGGTPPPVPLRTIFLAFFQIGLTAYGMAILQKLRALVIRRSWLTLRDALTNSSPAVIASEARQSSLKKIISLLDCFVVALLAKTN
jgi:hypothetical protein